MDLWRKLDEGGGEDLRVIILGLRKNRWPEVRQVMVQHLKHQLVITGMTTWMTACCPNHGLQHMMFPPVHEPRTRKERKRKVRGSSSNAAPPQAPTYVTGMTICMTSYPQNHGLQHMMFVPLYMNLEPEKRERESREVRQVMLHHLHHHHLSTGMTT